MLTNGCSASGMAFMKQTWNVRTESNCPQLCLLREAVHPIRRHYTLSDRVHRDVTGASRRNGCSASCSEPGASISWLRPMLPVGVCGEGLSAVGFVVGGGAPDP